MPDTVYLTVILILLLLLAALLLRLLPSRKKRKTANPWGMVPYGKRDDFLSRAEKAFFLDLRELIGDKVAICPKTAVREILYVTEEAGREKQRYFNWISQKHVDFVLCDWETMEVLCAVELDDSSHQRPDRVQRDLFMDKAFLKAGIPLFHVKWRPSYIREDFREILELLKNYAPPEGQANDAAPPLCPKCGAEMVRRVAKSGPYEGLSFWGCSHFPQCNGIRRE